MATGFEDTRTEVEVPGLRSGSGGTTGGTGGGTTSGSGGYRRLQGALGSEGYFFFVFTFLGGWSFVLFLLASSRIPVVVSAADLANTAQVASGLAAVALALLTIVQGNNSNGFYLKSALGILTVLFIAASLTAGVVLLVRSDSYNLTAEVPLYMAGAVAIVLVFHVVLGFGHREPTQGVRASAWVYLYPLTPVLTLLVLVGGMLLGMDGGTEWQAFSSEASMGTILDALTIHRIAVLSMLTMLGATIGLAALTVAFVISVSLRTNADRGDNPLNNSPT